ncbi:hypothetical protein ACIBHX_15040 [Nonomuraea sp. NPDC050536]|uniref:hypothetical protein n=1 Tax=Nonomuraea sp. NPDC050536 TaxID=3364366 RepID=UPI0037CBB927
MSDFSPEQMKMLLGTAHNELRAAARTPVVGGSYDSSPGIGAGEVSELALLGDRVKDVLKDDLAADQGDIEASGQIVFGGGVPVGGWTSIALFPNGAYNMSGHMHVSGAPSYNVAVTWIVTTCDGNPSFSLTAQGRVHGTFESGSRDFNWNTSGTNPALAAAWPELSGCYRWQWKAGANIDIGAMINSAAQAIGTAGAIIALI